MIKRMIAREDGRKVYIMAGRYNDAARFAEQHELGRDEWVHVHSVEQLRGISGTYLHVVQPLGRRQVGLDAEARTRGWKIIDASK